MNQVNPLAFAHPEAKLGDNSIVGPFYYIDKNTVIGDSDMFQNSVTIHIGARLGSNNGIFPGASISTKPQDLEFRDEETLCEIGDNNSIRENVTVSRDTAPEDTTKVGSNNLLMECVHIAHDCVVGSDDIIDNATKLAGEVTADDNTIVSANILCRRLCHIGRYVMMQGGSRFSMDIPPYIIVGEEPARYMGIDLIDLRRRGFSNELIELIHNACRILYGTGTRAKNVQKVENELQIMPEIQKIIDFVESSGHSVIKQGLSPPPLRREGNL